MKRPSFTPTHIGVTDPDAAGGLALHLRDANSNQQVIHLTAGLRATLGQRLVSEPLLEQDAGGTVLYMAPTKTRVYLRENGEFVVELHVGGRAVHVLLPGLHADALALQIQEVRRNSGSPPSGH